MTLPPSFQPGSKPQRDKPVRPDGSKQDSNYSKISQTHPAHMPPSFAPASSNIAQAHNPKGSNEYLEANGIQPRTNQASQAVTFGQEQKSKTLRIGRLGLIILLVLLLSICAWIGYLYHRTTSQLQRIDALSQAPQTPGTTTLLAGSDERGGTVAQDGTEGKRSDSILIIHTAPNGQASLISLPRDSYVQIPGYSPNKLNAAYAFGGPKLLVSTVEQLLGIKIDHYLEIGMAGVEHLVDGVGGIELCYDKVVNDPLSGMNWQPGCRLCNGKDSLAFSRMRYQDPLGDIGRTLRQRQVISKTLHKVFTWPTFVSPKRQLALVDAGTGAVHVDQKTGIWDLFNIARALRKAGQDKMEGTLPIASLNYRPGGVGSTVKLDSERLNDMVEKLLAGHLTNADLSIKP